MRCAQLNNFCYIFQLFKLGIKGTVMVLTSRRDALALPLLLVKALSLAFLVLGFGIFASPASAATCGAVDYTVKQGGMTLTPTGCDSGNDEGSKGYGTNNGWTLGDSIGGGPGDGNIQLTLYGQMWSITNTGNYTHLGLAVKHAQSFAFYVLDLSKALSGTWATLGSNGQGQSINGYSHINAWYKDGGTPPPPPSNVPLPAAAWMLIAALGSLVVFRKKSA